MKVLGHLIILLYTTLSFSQQTFFFDMAFHKRVNDSKSKNVRKYMVSDSLIEIQDFKNEILYRSGKFYGFKDLKNLDEFIWYFSQNKYQESASLYTENRYGFVKYFNKNRELTTEQFFDGKEVKYIQLWNNQKPILNFGTGKFVCNTEDENEKIVRVFKDSIQVEGFFTREIQKDTIYFVTDTKAYPRNGLKAFYADLASNINYPKFAALLGLEKKINITFIVDKDGNLTEFKPINNKSLNFEKKAIRRLEKMPKWKPATVNGKPVKTKFNIPFVFKR
jgi:hypothetical protein